MAVEFIANIRGPQGPQGLRGFAASAQEPQDQAVGSWAASAESITGAAVRAAAAEVWQTKTVAPSTSPYIQLSPAVAALPSGGKGILALKSNADTSNDDGTRIYVMPRAKVTSSVGGTIKLFGDPFFDNAAYRDLGLYFSADQNTDTGTHGTGVFWMNSKVGTAGGTSFEGEYKGKNPDIGFSFQDSVVGGRFSLIGPANPVFVVGSGAPNVAKRHATVRLEMQGDLAFQGTSRVIRWESVASTTADNAMVLEAGQLRIEIQGTSQLAIKQTGSLVMGGGTNLATTATDGFLYMRAMAGTPTGAPTAWAGSIPMVIDGTGSKLWARIAGVWKSVTFA